MVNRRPVRAGQPDHVARARDAQRNRANNRANNQGFGDRVAIMAKKILTHPATLVGGLAAIAGYVGLSSQTAPQSQPQASVAQPTVPQATVPEATTPKVPTRIMNLDYSKGDSATTLEEYKAAVGEDLKVTGNKVAKDPSKFDKGRILVMGEDHRNPRLPGIPGGRGAVLLESEDLSRCQLPKYAQDPSNICKSIDKGRDVKVDQQSLIKTIANVYKSGQKLLDMMDPQAMSKLKANLNGQSSVWAILQPMSDYIHYNFDQALRSASPQEQRALVAARKEFDQDFAETNRLTLLSSASRDDIMVDEAAKVIKNLDKDAGAAIVVGNLHAKPIAKKLTQAFPERPVVLATDHEADKLIREHKVS